MISKILIPHDGTEMSDKAFEKAVELAKMFKAELILLHVIEVKFHQSQESIVVSINRANKIARRELEKGWDKMVDVKIHQIENDKVALRGECRNGSVASRSCAS